MPFHPSVDLQLEINEAIYSVAEHPVAPGIPYGQEGKAAVVYKLDTPVNGSCALKVFKAAYRAPVLARQAVTMASFAELPALRVCQRTVLSALRHGALLQQYPDLVYAVLMPWIEGPTWADVITGKREISPETALSLAKELASALVTMEEHGLAHCDLSSSNVLLPALLPDSDTTNGYGIELVDVEQIYGADLRQPDKLTMGTSGYAHRVLSDASWGATADRFAGAVLLVEMLGWCVPEVRAGAWDTSYFGPDDMHQDGQRFETLVTALKQYWGRGIVDLFERAWHSNTLEECPTFGEWLVSLPENFQEPEGDGGGESVLSPELEALITLAQELYSREYFAAAAVAYRHAQRTMPDTASRALLDKQIGKCEERTAEQPAIERDDNEHEEIVDPLAETFDEGLHAFQDDCYREAAEFLGEVVRQNPDYTREGWQAQKLLADAEARSRPFWQRAWRYSVRILVSALLVLVIVSGVFTVSYLTFIRPIVTDSIFTFLRPLLHELTYLSDITGCWTTSEQEINTGLAGVVPMLVEGNDLHIDIYDGYFRASAQIGGRPAWLMLDPPEGYHGSDFALDSLEMSGLLKVLFSPTDLADFINEYATTEVISPGKIRQLAFFPDEGSLKICILK